MYKDIEFICTGNNGRSPIALAVANDFILNRGISGKVRVTSSGTLVRVMSLSSNAELEQYIRKDVETAVNKGILRADELNHLSSDAREVLRKLLSYEKESREAYLGKRKLRYNQEPMQTVRRDEAELIFAISNANLRRVQRIYSGRDVPAFELGSYAGRPNTFELGWILTRKEFFDVADRLYESTISCLWKIF
jgi:hypothetical protein